MKNKILIYEFDCLYSLLNTDNDILTKIFSNIIIPQIVYDEFIRKADETINRSLKNLLKNKIIVLEDFEVESEQFTLYKKLIKGIECKSRGKLESAAITIAKYNHLTILSNSSSDNFNEFNINSVLISDFIINEYHRNIITIDEAQVLWDNLSVFCKKFFTGNFTQLLTNET